MKRELGTEKILRRWRNARYDVICIMYIYIYYILTKKFKRNMIWCYDLIFWCDMINECLEFDVLIWYMFDWFVLLFASHQSHHIKKACSLSHNPNTAPTWILNMLTVRKGISIFVQPLNDFLQTFLGQQKMGHQLKCFACLSYACL